MLSIVESGVVMRLPLTHTGNVGSPNDVQGDPAMTTEVLRDYALMNPSEL